jgi:hypothetical protein
MQQLAKFLILGPVVGVSLFTMFLSWQLQGGQCAEIRLPLDTKFAIGETCRSSR